MEEAYAARQDELYRKKIEADEARAAKKAEADEARAAKRARLAASKEEERRYAEEQHAIYLKELAEQEDAAAPVADGAAEGEGAAGGEGAPGPDADEPEEE